MTKECIFCKIAKREIPKDFLYENDNFLSFFDIHPVVERHTIIISKKHFRNFLDLPNSLGTELLDCIKKTIMKLQEEKKFEGFNIANNNFEAAGQIVDHFHLHILPRNKQDGFKFGV